MKLEKLKQELPETPDFIHSMIQEEVSKQIKEDKDFRTLGVLVNIGGYHVSDASLKEFCDSITLVSNITDLTDSDSNVNTSIFGAL